MKPQPRSPRVLLRIGVVLLVALALAPAVEFWDIEACRYDGGAWDRLEQTCVRDRAYEVEPSAYPTWVFAIAVAASIGTLLTACASVRALLARRWTSARVLSGYALVTSLGVFLVAMALAISAGMSKLEGPDSNATRLGRSISQFMNATAGSDFAFLIAFASGLIAAIQKWRAQRRRD